MSLIFPGDPVLLMKTKSAKSAAAEGVFSTMMTASRQSSRQQSASQPQASTAASSDTHQTFSRHSEQMLLDRVFSDVLDTSASAPAQLQSFGFGAASRCCSEATAVEGEASLWKQASQDEPPHCTLEDRVQKRKAAQHIAQEQARKEAIAQQCIAAEAMLKSCETAEPSGSVNKAVDKQLCSLRNCPESGGQSMCIDLVSSPGEKSQEGATCSQQLPAAACAAVLSKLQDVNDPMKRIRLLALQQELKAAKQTVSDLERMILEVNSST